jgi:hypothetical protein
MSTVHGGQGNIITNGLLLYLDAANPRSYPPPYNSTTWSNLSNNAISGALTNGPTFNTGSGGNIVFDGTNDFVGITPSGYNLGVNFTLQVWTRITRFGGLVGGVFNRASLISNSYPYSANQGFFFCATSQGAGAAPTPGLETFFISMGSDQFVAGAVTGSLTAYVNQWVQLATVVNGTNPIRLYINGSEPVYSSQGNGPSSLLYTGGPFRVGVRNNSDEPIQGSIAQTLIYNRALTSTEILQNYNATRGRFSL